MTIGTSNTSTPSTGVAVTQRRGTTWRFLITGLGDISAYDTLYLSVKTQTVDSDEKAVLRVKNDASGLLRWNGATVSDATLGSITIDDAVAGDITVYIDEAVTNTAVSGTYTYAIKGVDNDGDVDMLATEAVFTIIDDVTRATS